ncbi:uncharacterized protein BJ171DRAFT_509912 [Polychytrium aggregatum]|uniref:uncharacterized protein n=1 Tax=Polychytrium aggregatum TaxID=110093 RepID=UPI0022FE7DBD|nr:uncharacterized protein BJ171DRAFT_509912 [Polychytrium aggregatum]KAI9203542.1 hypothetical protein BJ171DRAFT_509912 [Polychytrium aggregatum]
MVDPVVVGMLSMIAAACLLASISFSAAIWRSFSMGSKLFLRLSISVESPCSGSVLIASQDAFLFSLVSRF